MTQQVLRAEKHILFVNGKEYPLEVTAYSAEVNPNEVRDCVDCLIVRDRVGFGLSGCNLVFVMEKKIQVVHPENIRSAILNQL